VQKTMIMGGIVFCVCLILLPLDPNKKKASVGERRGNWDLISHVQFRESGFRGTMEGLLIGNDGEGRKKGPKRFSLEQHSRVIKPFDRQYHGF